MAISAKPGSDHKSATFKSDNMTLEMNRDRGTSKTYALRKLHKDRPDLHAKVVSKELSSHGDMGERGGRVPSCCSLGNVLKMSAAEMKELSL